MKGADQMNIIDIIIIIFLLMCPFLFALLFFLNHIRLLLKDKKDRLRCIAHCERTQYILNKELKFIISAEAPVGGGKSSFAAGVSHYQTLKYLDMIQNKIDWTRKIVHQADYIYLNSFIETKYQVEYLPHKKIYELALLDQSIAPYFEGTYSDHVTDYPLPGILEDYIIAYTAKLRNNFVCSSYTIFNRITETFNYDFDFGSLNVKSEESRKNYHLFNYCIYLEDEKALSDYKNTGSFKEFDKLGQDTTLRLFRQLKKETASYMSLSQNSTRVAKLIRELTNTRILIEEMTIEGAQKYRSSLFKNKEDKQAKKEENHYRKLIKEDPTNAEIFINNSNDYKKRIFTLYQARKGLFASSYVRYKVLLTHSQLDTTKDSYSNHKSYELYFPLTWVFGVYNSTEFSEFDEFLNKLSNKTDFDYEVIKSFYDDSKNDERFKKLIEVKLTKTEEIALKRAEKKGNATNEKETDPIS